MKFLFRSVDIASLAWFRIVFGILGFADIMGTWTYKHLYKDSFNPEKFQFKYYGFEWIQPINDPWMSLIFILGLLGAIGIMLGKWYRRSAILFATVFTYQFFLEKGYYLNHGYLTILLSWAMVLLPAQREWSADIVRKPALRLGKIPYWPLFFLRFMMGMVYFFGGVAKINSDWLQAQPLKIWLKHKSDMPLLGGLWAQEWVAYAMSYGGLVLDLFVVFFLSNRRMRPWALGFVLFFHATNFILFRIGIFPFLSIALTLLYFSPDFPRRWGQKIWPIFLRFCRITGIPWLIHRLTAPLTWQQANTEYKPYSSIQQRSISLSLLVFAVILCLIPLRHHLFPGHVAWTEEGHRYSWRMMLRSKQGNGHFKVKDLETGEIWRVRAEDYLTKRQKQKLFTHPDMILQFAHFIRDEYHTKGHASVAVFAKVRARLNGRKYQDYIDSKVDLAQEEWHTFQSEKWILDFKD